MKRILCLDTTKPSGSSLYNVQGHFIEGLDRAFNAIGLESRLVLGHPEFPGEMIAEIIKDRPDCTVAFNGIPSNDQGYYICDDLKIPHISILIDAPYLFLGQANASLALFTSIDRSSVGMYRALGLRNLSFLPHAADARETGAEEAERVYDVVMLSSFIDPDKTRDEWKGKYPSYICRAMDRAVETLLSAPEMGAPIAFIEALNREGIKAGLGEVPLWLVLYEIDKFVRGRDRLGLVRSIKDAKVDLFSSSHKGSWKDLINQSNIAVHEPVGFAEALDIMGKSKVVLNSSPHIPDGAHERVLSGLLKGASVLSSYSKYLSEQFPEGSGIKFYSPGKYGQVDEVLSGLLSDEGARRNEAEKGKLLVRENHMWETRARQIRDELGPVIDSMNSPA